MGGDNLLQALLEHVRVDFGRGNVGVTEKLLHSAQIGAAVEQVAGKSMAQHVRADAIGGDACLLGDGLELLPQPLARRVALLGGRGKEPARAQHGCHVLVFAGADGEIEVEGRAGGSVEGHEAFAAALALDGQDAPIAVKHGPRQRDKLGDTHARGIGHLEETVDAERRHPLAAEGRGRAPPRCLHQPIDLGDVEGARQGALLLRPGEARTGFLADKLAPYEQLVAMHLERGDAESLRKAFRFVEMAKSRSLADLMAQHVVGPRAAGAGRREVKLREQLARRLEELSWYSSRIANQSEKGGQRNTRLDAHLRTELARCERELESVFRRLEVEDANFAELVAAEPTEIEELAAGLEADEAAVEFFVAGNNVAAFVVTPDGSRAYGALADRRSVEAHVTGLRYQLEKFALGARYATAHRDALRRCVDNHLSALHGALFAPLADRIYGRRLVVIPHGLLHYIPMHALKGPDGRYVVEDHEVSYAPSATVHRLCRGESSPTTPATSMLAVGLDDAMAPHIVDELRSLEGLFPKAVTLAGPHASKQQFLDLAPQSRILHLATHGSFRHDNPMFSSVRLADGPLNFYDVFDMSLEADLVTLSACNTGMNRLSPGDELSGLMRGFLYAGAPSLLVSLWSVNDRSTADLMRSFYSQLQAGADKRAALRAAELESLERYGHPYYWAPFVLMGRA